MRIFLLLLMLCGFQVFAEQLPSVTDLTGTLTTEEQTALNQQLQTLEQQTTSVWPCWLRRLQGAKTLNLQPRRDTGYITGNPLERSDMAKVS